ncbi:alkaline phosphatase PhoX [Alteromonas sp. P256]|uniref:alkaline phosphatase PhoX n=1 Tax=Alteromonas sp. P256 TaxID=3117399 RepID=UPI002FE11FC7
MITRRQFMLGSLAFGGLASSAFGKSQLSKAVASAMPIARGYGNLVKDKNSLLDLPEGFAYRVISQFGDAMSDGLHVPDRADGMGCFGLDEQRVALIRNHELHPTHIEKQPQSIQQHSPALFYDSYSKGSAFEGTALPGGTSTLVYNLSTHKVEREFISLSGTVRNCSGGITPWGTWLTCEESVDKPNGVVSKDHGYIFEVPASATSMTQPKPLKAMGRFNHEAASVDPRTGMVYLTEDRGDSVLYRFVPNTPAKLAGGGKLQALRVVDKPQFDSRNWNNPSMETGQWFDIEWVDLDNPESPEDDLRIQAYKKGAALFARGEGMHWGDEELYFCCTNGGEKQLGQVMRLVPSVGGSADKLQLFLQSEDKSLYNFGDNLTVCPNGHLLVCEDQYTDIVDNHLRGVTPEGEVYNFAKLHAQTELAGACFSPDGSTLFVNVYSPTKTLAITGPWLSS